MNRPQVARPETGVGTGPSARATIAILDFGSQYTQLIARRGRESRVYCEIFPHDITRTELDERDVTGAILSGGPASVYEPGAPPIDTAILDGTLPVLGACYGMPVLSPALVCGVVAERKR